ncbi:hypothetical protein P153DRAFT_371708 [Dothidotthia symphoricarpi CBS 119687]|uniref:Uncharacterized protein n=1 Tax=Dothidotthia symphoricarpi CBS 119687 TaxID=1392245 RepID=A0A6A5ZVS0_9PLEO|nr:uncharacterized protein P153DRAFT_371708 [Dothidotthia symphoricarpi CBS 119687]KAF2123386.1 hypothetical protein P153DRAFT_371708 [Dothidotthia symphoricarpi CBS 119687]
MPVQIIPHTQTRSLVAASVAPFRPTAADFPPLEQTEDIPSRHTSTPTIESNPTWVSIAMKGLYITKANTFLSFLKLAPEIRDILWDIAMQDARSTNEIDLRDFTRRAQNVNRPTFLPTICRVSKSTSAETMGVFLRGSTFTISSFADNEFFVKFLNNINAFDAVRRLHFRFFDCFPTSFADNADLELAVRCPGLVSVKLGMHTSKLVMWVLEGEYEDGLTRFPRRVQEMWEHYKLDRLLDCDKLQEVVIERKGRSNDEAVQAACALGECIKQRYMETRKRELLVEYSVERRVYYSRH